jgi:hypothetical protein
MSLYDTTDMLLPTMKLVTYVTTLCYFPALTSLAHTKILHSDVEWIGLLKLIKNWDRENCLWNLPVGVEITVITLQSHLISRSSMLW